MTANPFSPTAVAQAVGTPGISVDTDQIRTVRAYLDDYLDAPLTGTVIAVLGDYGSGKTHLAGQLLAHAGEGVDHVYLEAAPTGFIELHRRFVDSLRPGSLRALLNEVHAEIVADVLESIGAPAQTVQWLRDGQLEPQAVVTKLQLQQSNVLRRVRARLHEITRHRTLSNALTLLLRHGFDSVVWEWMRGQAPDQLLVERDIVERIDTDTAALEMMGALVQLCACGNRRFLLVIDELHRVVADADNAGMNAFQSFLEQIDTAGAFVVVTGLPELRTLLPQNVRQRITHEISISRFSTDHAYRLVEHALLGQGFKPFGKDVVDYLVKIADGVPRLVIRLCYQLYRRWSADGTLITEELVREVARDLSVLSSEDVEGETKDVLDTGEFSYLRHHFLGQSEVTRVDFWVTFSTGSAGCAIVLTDSVLRRREAEQLTAKVLALRKIALDCRVLLVVQGTLTPELDEQLTGVLTSRPLVYRKADYAAHLTALLRNIEAEARTEPGNDPIKPLYRSLVQITRQQAAIHGFIERVAERLDEMRSTWNVRLEAIQTQLDAISGEVRPEGGPPVAEQAVQLPDQVDQAFAAALEHLVRLVDVNAAVAGQFTGSGQEVPHFLSRDLEPAAVAIVLRPIVLEFRENVGIWYRDEVLMTRGQVPPRVYDRLDELCAAFDRLTENVPLARLQELAPDGKPDLLRTFYSLSMKVRLGFR